MGLAGDRCILVTGGTGRIATLLRRAWARDAPPFDVLWQTRDPARGAGFVLWDMLASPCPALDPAPRVILHLAGVTAGRGADLDDNVRLARSALGAARLHGGAHLFLASSVAVYRPGADRCLSEDEPADPVTPYGGAKARMEAAALRLAGPGLTLLRIGNVLGAGPLFGAAPPDPVRSVTLDPVPGRDGGPLRNWIGPQVLADVLASLLCAALDGRPLPRCLNVAQHPALTMASLLDAADVPWRHGPVNPGVIARMSVSADRLRGCVGDVLPCATPAGLIADWRMLASGTA